MLGERDSFPIRNWAGSALVWKASLLLLVALAGCGYTTRSTLPGHLRMIAVKPFVNKIDTTKELSESQQYRRYRPGMETQITTAVVNRFLFDGNLKIAREDDADLILEGELVDYIRDALRYAESGNVEEFRSTIVVKVTVKDVQGKKMLWEDPQFKGDTTYFAQGPDAIGEETAVDRAITDLARRIVERTIEGW